MKLGSLLSVIDNCEDIVVYDDNACIDVPPLFDGTIHDCKNRSDIKNGVVKLIMPEKNSFAVFIDIEYQKKRWQRERNHDYKRMA